MTQDLPLAHSLGATDLSPTSVNPETEELLSNWKRLPVAIQALVLTVVRSLAEGGNPPPARGG
jgi:hypothetical protein